jgi:tetratricopeptide (TPR) repeat protein
VLGVDARHRRAALVHYAVLLQLGKAQALFALAHAAVDAAPKDALSWYAVGCYYLAAHKPVQAVKHFTRATQFDPAFAPAWGGLGQAFAVQDEPEPALAAYRAAMKLWPASHLPPLAMASLCVRTGQLVLAQQHASLAQVRGGRRWGRHSLIRCVLRRAPGPQGSPRLTPPPYPSPQPLRLAAAATHSSIMSSAAWPTSPATTPPP